MNERILVIDDEPSVREFMQRALSHYKYQVTTASDGNAGIQALQDNEAFDLMITDIVMPDLDGISLALKVSNDYPDMKIMLMSGYAQQRDRAYNLEELVVDVLNKPFSIEELCERVEIALKIV